MRHDPQLSTVGRERGFGRRDERLERRHIRSRQLGGERVDDQRRLFPRGGHCLPLIEQLLDHRLIHDAGHRRQLLAVRAERELRIRDHGAQQWEHRFVEAFVQRVQLQLGESSSAIS